MKMRCFVGAVLVCFAAAGVSQAIDSIKTTTAKQPLRGRVVGMSPTTVSFEQGAAGSIAKDIAVNTIQSIDFEDEPSELKFAKGHVQAGRYAEGLASLNKIKEEASRAEIKQDIDFYKAICTAKLALGGSGKIAEAGRMMKSFADGNTKSYHYFEAAEAVGDLLVAARSYKMASDYYARLEKAPWPEYQMRADAAIGRALLAQGKIAEAEAAFDRVLAKNVSNEAAKEMAQTQRTLAKLGKASVLVASKKPDEAVKIVEEILKTADPEDAELLARAYNVLGSAHRQAGRPKEALLAYLHVDVLYSSLPDAHAEALANLAELWEQVHKSERANRAQKALEEEYPDSPWAKKGG